MYLSTSHTNNPMVCLLTRNIGVTYQASELATRGSQSSRVASLAWRNVLTGTDMPLQFAFQGLDSFLSGSRANKQTMEVCLGRCCVVGKNDRSSGICI